MCTRSLASCVALGVVVAVIAQARAADGPNLGREATPAEIAGWDISIPPDGSGLPPGGGTAAAGAALYAAKCQSCHGEKGAGQPNDRLVGDRKSVV